MRGPARRGGGRAHRVRRARRPRTAARARPAGPGYPTHPGAGLRAARRRVRAPPHRRGGATDLVELASAQSVVAPEGRIAAARYTGTFSADGDTLTGAWVWPGGGYQTTSTRQLKSPGRLGIRRRPGTSGKAVTAR